MNEFINALQLSLNSEIDSISDDDADGMFTISFVRKPKQDERLKDFVRITDGVWSDDQTLEIHFDRDEQIEVLTDFLYLTRLQRENIEAIARFNQKYRSFAEKLFGKQKGTNVSSLEELSGEIFRVAKEKGMTIREISEQSGLTQATISRFKSGQDFKVSNLMNVLKALGLDLQILSR